MSILATFADGINGILATFVPFLFVLMVVVFIHELGHFLVARWCGVRVQAFSIGFGREIWGFYDRHGTRWKLAWIPLGGYVKFMDDENAASAPGKAVDANDPGNFHNKPLWQKAAVVAAGPIANFLSAIAIFAVMFSISGYQVVTPRIGEVIADSPAAAAGFQSGDVITAIDGRQVDSFNDVVRIISAVYDRQISVSVDRGGVGRVLQVTPRTTEFSDRIGGTYRRSTIGVRPDVSGNAVQVQKVGPLRALALGVGETGYIISSTLQYLGDVALGRQKADQLGGPIRIAEVSGQVAKIGIEPLIQLIALISVSVGLLNLFPIPLLDGGHLMFYAAEAVMRRPLSERTLEIGFRIGLAVVLALMVFATWNDLPILMRWLTGG